MALNWKTRGSGNGGRRVQPPGDGIGLSNLGSTLYRGGPPCQPTYNWEMLVRGLPGLSFHTSGQINKGGVLPT
ncbi:MAG: hypothetical protein ACK559_04010 [bacterium]